MELIKSRENLGEKKEGDLMHKICLCPTSIAWIKKHLMKSAKAKFNQMIKGNIKSLTKHRKSKKHRTAKQRRATKKLIAFNKRHR